MIGATFKCNICGGQSAFRPEGDWREAPSCAGCRSSVRMRGLIHALTSELLGRSVVLEEMAPEPFRGAGLSDWDGYAGLLAQRFAYTNTYFHQEPRLDITDPGPGWRDSCDFLISSDVLEHVPAPVNRAFTGSFDMLRPGGLLVMTAPYGDDPETVEHYPEGGALTVAQVGQDWVVVTRDTHGRFALDTAPVFHGGPGTTLEMRMFGRADLLGRIAEAGFVDIKVHDQPYPPWGVFPPHHWGLPMTGRKPR